MVIHKLEYFLNARIVGAGIKAKAWGTALAMLAMESLFGVPGVVAAPIYYAYLGELAEGADQPPRRCSAEKGFRRRSSPGRGWAG